MSAVDVIVPCPGQLALLDVQPGVPDSTPFLHADRPYCPLCGMSARFRWAGCTATFHDDLEERRSAMFDGWV